MGGDRRWTLVVVCVATALLLLNVSAPNVALPAIAQGVGASFEELQWILSGYALCLATFQLTAGSLADLLGRKRMFLLGLLGFAATSALCALAPSPVALILARALQGCAAAVVFPSSLAILAHAFEGPARARAIGIWGGTIGLSFAIGPLIGGLLVDTVGWRALFALGVVLGLPIAGVAARSLRESRDPDADPVDWTGVGLLTLGLFTVLFGLLRGNALGWGSAPVLGMLAAGLAGLAAFLAWERRERAPMLDLGLFRNRTFTGATLVVGLSAASVFGVVVYLSLYLLVIRRGSPVEVGLQLAPMALASFVVALGAPRVLSLVPIGGALTLGMALSVIGLLALHGLDPATPWLVLLPGLLLLGTGIGLANPLVTLTHLGVLPPAHGGLASGINNTARQLGVALGIAILGTLLQGRLGALVADAPVAARLGGAREEVLASVRAGDLEGALAAAPAGARDAVRLAYDASFTSALDDVLVLSAVLATLGTLAAAVLVRGRDLHPAARTARAAEAPA